MNLEEAQNEVKKLFFESGTADPYLAAIGKMEGNHAGTIQATFGGFLTRVLAFEALFFESLKSGEASTEESGWSSGNPAYPQFVLSMVSAFKAFRASRILGMNGYPIQSLVQMRDIKDRAVNLSGFFGGHCTFEDLAGLRNRDGSALTPPEQTDLVKKLNLGDCLRRNRERVESLVLRIMVHEAPGLSESDRLYLRIWSDAFSKEIHGAQISAAFSGGPWMAGDEGLSLGPEYKEMESAWHMNRASEMAWFFCRLLPYLQPPGLRFEPEWEARLIALETSLAIYVRDLGGKRDQIGEALSKWADYALSFDPQRTFPAS